MERFPDAKYVFIARDPRNNIRSLLDSRGLPGDRSALRNEDTQHLSSSRTLLNGEAWQISADNYIELLSRRWVRAIQGLHTLRKAPSDCLLIKYEDFYLKNTTASAGLHRGSTSQNEKTSRASWTLHSSRAEATEMRIGSTFLGRATCRSSTRCAKRKW